jgi:hypothetical protein
MEFCRSRSGNPEAMQFTNGTFSEILIRATCLRMTSDCDDDLSMVFDAEKRVIEDFTKQELRPHSSVTLFVLESLSPLVVQLQKVHGLRARQTALLTKRPMVNIYDLMNPREFFVFVNINALIVEKYWGNAVAIEGLLAHEHANPISECPAIAATRALSVTVEAPLSLISQIAQLAETLSVGALAEIRINETCIINEFAASLAHLDRVTVCRAAKNIAQRPELHCRLKAASAEGVMITAEESLHRLVADLQIALPFALEAVPFFRAADGAGILDALHTFLLPHLEPDVASIFMTLHQLYLRPQPDWRHRETELWCREVLLILPGFLSQRGIQVSVDLTGEVPPTQEVKSA